MWQKNVHVYLVSVLDKVTIIQFAQLMSEKFLDESQSFLLTPAINLMLFWGCCCCVELEFAYPVDFFWCLDPSCWLMDHCISIKLWIGFKLLILMMQSVSQNYSLPDFWILFYFCPSYNKLGLDFVRLKRLLFQTVWIIFKMTFWIKPSWRRSQLL